LVAAALLARAGYAVLVLERAAVLGGAAISSAPFAGVGARVSRYAYLVSLFPASLARSLGLAVALRRRRVSAYSPLGDAGLLIAPDPGVTRDSIASATGDPRAFDAWRRFHAMLGRVAARLFPTLTQPLPGREELRRLIDDRLAWRALFEEPLSELLERTFASDALRGVVLTDALIGTFAPAADPLMRQNRCFLYHVIGNGTGSWDVPVGGMGALTDALARCATRAGVELQCSREVTKVHSDGRAAEVECADGTRFGGRHLLANVAPSALSTLLGRQPATPTPEGSQLKLNMVLARLPRLCAGGASVRDAFSGTFHVNEGYAQLQAAYDAAAAGRIPSPAPCELYCHSLTDPTILSNRLRAAGAQTMTIFGLHMPARLFVGADREAKDAAVAATLRSVNSVLAEPIEDCLLVAADGAPCLEAHTPLELEAALGLPGGHIFHRDLAWPFAESEHERGSWGVETDDRNVWLCGAGARRGGGVSGIPGHNAARAVLAADARR
jgi:phytoene dehydrogenase-like protein